MDPPSITVTTDSAIESTIDGQGGADILNDFLVQGTPAPRRISQYDNSLRRGATHGDSDTDSSDLDGTSLAQLQRQANLAKEGNEQSDSGDSDDDEKDLADMVLAASKKTGGSTIVKKMPSAASAESLASGSSSKASKPTGEEKAVKRRPAGELAKQLKFLGKQFNTIESDEVKHVLEKEKAKRDVYSFEWEANEQKPEWKQALLLSTMRPADGLKYLAGLGLMKNTPEARAKWLSHYRRMVLDNPIVIEWLCHEPNLPILECMVEQENAMAGLDIDVAFRRFVMKMDYLPDGEGLERLLNVFSGEYVARNPHRKEVVSIASAAYICNSMLALNNMYHMNRKLRRLRINDWISQSAGKNAGNDYPVGMLEEIFSNILSLPLTFDDPNSSSGYKGERRHGWVSHKLFEAKGWKKFWAVLSDKGELFLLPEDGKSATPIETLDVVHGELKPTKPSEKYHLIALKIGDRIHLLQVHSLWARETWFRHLSKFAETSESRSAMVALKDSAFSPSPIRNALKGHTRKLSQSTTRPGLKLGGGAVSPSGGDNGLEDDELPPGALEALNGME